MDSQQNGAGEQDHSVLDQTQAGPERVFPAKLNCTAKRFIDVVLTGVVRQLNLAGVKDAPATSLAFHLDAGRSQPEGGGREIPAEEEVNITGRALEAGCTEAQVLACHKATRGLASLEGLADYLVAALEGGVADPKPGTTTAFGFGPVAKSLLTEQARQGPPTAEAANPLETLLEVGGGSGAGFQIICDDKGLASAGGGGGGGAGGPFSSLAAGTTPSPQPSGSLQLGVNDSIGGGGGGGVQLFTPVDPEAEPWMAGQWKAWGTGGGSGCGSCGKDDEQCKALGAKVACGAKFDDDGAGPEARQQAEGKTQAWRESVLRRCFDSGRLAVIGGGGGGAGGAGCCRTTPTLNYGFGFRATLTPKADEAEATGMEGASSRTLVFGEDCCPDLAGWNVTDAGQSTSSTRSRSIAGMAGGSSSSSDSLSRRLSEVPQASFQYGQTGFDYGAIFGTSSNSSSVDPFAAEHGHPEQNIGGANRLPTVQEMINQHAERSGFVKGSRPELEGLDGPRCPLPPWLNGTSDPDLPRAGGETKESAEALRYIYRYNPLQGHLVDGAARCGGWGDWCCLCHSAQRRIACLPDPERHRVEWFLIEDCCESQVQRNVSSQGFVEAEIPPRNATVAWRPGVGWQILPGNGNGTAISDSYVWDGELGLTRCLPYEDVSALEVSQALAALRAGASSTQGAPRAQPTAGHHGAQSSTWLLERYAADHQTANMSAHHWASVMMVLSGLLLMMPILLVFNRPLGKLLALLPASMSGNSESRWRRLKAERELMLLDPATQQEGPSSTPYCLMVA